MDISFDTSPKVRLQISDSLSLWPWLLHSPGLQLSREGTGIPLQLNACKCYWNWWQLLMRISRQQRTETMSWNLLSSAHKESVARFPKGGCFTHSPFVPLVIHNSCQLDKTLAELVLRSHNSFPLHREFAFPFISKWHTSCCAQNPGNSYSSPGKVYYWQKTW